jgi:peptide/nickel transport system substrate-binding protein
MTKAPWTDLKVRQAVAHAINRSDIAENLWRGNAEPVLDLLAPPFEESTGVGEAVGYPYNPPRAKAILAEAGWKDNNGDGIVEKDGQVLRGMLICSDQTEFTQLAERLRDNLKAVGMDIQMRRHQDLRPAKEAGEFDLALAEWWWQDADILDWWFNPEYVPYPNFTRWDDPESRILFDHQNSVETWEERVKNFKQINTHLTQVVAGVPIIAPHEVHITHKSVTNYHWHPFGPQQWVMTYINQGQ